MVRSVLLFLIINVLTLSTWKQDNWQNLETDVQSHLESIVAERLSRLFWELYENCEREQKVFMKLFIVNETTANYFNERTLWDRKDAICFVSVFEASDEVLKSWCTAKPDRTLLFLYDYSDKMKKIIGSKTNSYEALVHTNCLSFRAGEDYPRLPLLWPFNFRQDYAKRFLIYIVLTLAVFGILSFFYCHRRPIYKFFQGFWTVYRDRRDWNAINDVIKFRDQRIREDHERRQKTVQTTAL